MAKILVVDDEKDIRETLVDILSKEGYEVETASSGEEALSKLKVSKPDLVLLDVRMPGMNGVEVLRKVKEFDKEIAVGMITAYEDVDLAKEALGLGAYDYIKKPFNMEYLKQSVLSKVLP